MGTSGRVLSGQDPESHQESGEGRGEGGEPGAVARRPKREQVTKVTGLYREGQLGKGSPAPGLEKLGMRSDSQEDLVTGRAEG